MDIIGEQLESCTFIDAHHPKIEEDKTRVQRGNVQQRKLHVLRNPKNLAFKGWQEILELWTYANCEEYIEWCHINKNFPQQ
jgi:hypothetical protein